MNNESIKEILDSLKFVIDNPTLEDEVGDEQVTIINYTELNAEESKQLLDYITNLQQAIEVKNERIKEEQQEKERYIKFYNELNIWNKELKEENNKFNLHIQSQGKLISALRDMKNIDYKSRCEKAIELLNDENIIVKLQDFENKYTVNFYDKKKELLNILNGDDASVKD